MSRKERWITNKKSIRHYLRVSAVNYLTHGGDRIPDALLRVLTREVKKSRPKHINDLLGDNNSVRLLSSTVSQRRKIDFG